MKIVKKSQNKRKIIKTRRGNIETPFFMPDATRATVRGVLPQALKGVGVEALVVNTYHLFLQPGEALVKKAGGIHQFMNWDGPILSDSGGYQVFSLIHSGKVKGTITEEGAEFQSPETGEKHFLTPERSIQIQFDLGVDMMVVLDDPRPTGVTYEEMEASVHRTITWAERCKKEFERQLASRNFDNETRPLLFGVVQGGKEKKLRELCAEALLKIGFDGYAFGGRHFDEEGNFLQDIVEHTANLIPEQYPRFALGVGKPEDILAFHKVGWDMFDCVIPTREGRHGRLFICLENVEEENWYQTINIRNERFKEDVSPVDEDCDCELCKKYSRAYLRHLLSAGEPLALTLASLHNLRFYQRLMAKLRKKEKGAHV